MDLYLLSLSFVTSFKFFTLIRKEEEAGSRSIVLYFDRRLPVWLGAKRCHTDM